jgi:hypothetical protein
MDNPTKALIICIALVLGACKYRSSPHESNPGGVEGKTRQISRNSGPPVPEISIGKGLHLDSSGTLYLKVKNRKGFHPSDEMGGRHDSTFLSGIFDTKDSARRLISELIDTGTFKKVNAEGTYFMDTSRVYVHTDAPQFYQFFSLPRKGSRFIGKEMEYLLNGDRIYWHGSEIMGIRTSSLSLLKVARLPKDTLEFITDGKRLFLEDIQMDSNRINSLRDVNQSDKRKLNSILEKIR